MGQVDGAEGTLVQGLETLDPTCYRASAGSGFVYSDDSTQQHIGSCAVSQPQGLELWIIMALCGVVGICLLACVVGTLIWCRKKSKDHRAQPVEATWPGS